MIITGDDANGIAELKTHLTREFEMKDLVSLRYFLGIEVAYSPRGYILSQSKYIADILDPARLSDARTFDTPLELNARYSLSDGVALSDPSLYRTLVGSLVYLTITRPDIAYAVHIVSQFVASPTTVHWAAVLRILRYLRGTQFQSLFFPSTSTLELRAYSDADWGVDFTDRKSTTGAPSVHTRPAPLHAIVERLLAYAHGSSYWNKLAPTLVHENGSASESQKKSERKHAKTKNELDKALEDLSQIKWKLSIIEEEFTEVKKKLADKEDSTLEREQIIEDLKNSNEYVENYNEGLYDRLYWIWIEHKDMDFGFLGSPFAEVVDQ
ncbi:uncharacterized mitochondrial protein AtMg00810-like [Humulus lupulus]|uniref:uncharacterized mitochondrial protein AtMg00810-like n=1 Tax=Humulus lupulus TaxID=3486 RepID=UPI002B404D9C|nr:uncharacterized mitochondrial protein AtMg00810-like [Humulus lupulus]